MVSDAGCVIPLVGSRVFAKTQESIGAWIEVMRRKYRRDGLRHASDTTDAEWPVIEMHMPLPAPAQDWVTRDRERHLVYHPNRLPVVHAAR